MPRAKAAAYTSDDEFYDSMSDSTPTVVPSKPRRAARLIPKRSIGEVDSDSDELPSASEELSRPTTPPPSYVTPPVSPGKVNKDGSPRKEPTKRKYAQLDEQGNIIKIWDSARVAGAHFGVTYSSITSAASPKVTDRKTAGGYRWAYHEPDLDGEIWKPHPNIAHIQVSNKGRVCHKHGKKTYGYITSNGYRRVALYLPEKKFFRVHRLVKQTFDPYPGNDNFMDVNHIDGHKDNNCLENLEWVNREEHQWHTTNIILPKYKKQRLMKAALEGKFTRPEQVVTEKTIQYTDGTIETVKIIKTIQRKIPIEEAVASVQAMDD